MPNIARIKNLFALLAAGALALALPVSGAAQTAPATTPPPAGSSANSNSQTAPITLSVFEVLRNEQGLAYRFVRYTNPRQFIFTNTFSF